MAESPRSVPFEGDAGEPSRLHALEAAEVAYRQVAAPPVAARPVAAPPVADVPAGVLPAGAVAAEEPQGRSSAGRLLPGATSRARLQRSASPMSERATVPIVHGGSAIEPPELLEPGPPSPRPDLDRRAELLGRGAALLGATVGAAWLYEDGRLRLVARHGLPDAAAIAASTLSGPAALPWSRVLDGAVVQVARPERRPIAGTLAAALRTAGISTACAARITVPAGAGATAAPIEGMLVLGYPDSLVVSATTRDAITLLASQFGIVVESGRLVTSVERLEARLRAIEDLALRLNRIQDVRGIAEAIVAEVGALTSFDTVRVYLVDEVARSCEPVAFRGRFLGMVNPSDEILRVPVGVGLTGWVAAHGETLRIGNSYDDPRSRHVGQNSGPESMLVVPMAYEGRVRGVIVLSQQGRDRFTIDDQTTLTVFAGHAAQAIVNAEFYESGRPPAGRAPAPARQPAAPARGQRAAAGFVRFPGRPRVDRGLAGRRRLVRLADDLPGRSRACRLPGCRRPRSVRRADPGGPGADRDRDHRLGRQPPRGAPGERRAPRSPRVDRARHADRGGVDDRGPSHLRRRRARHPQPEPDGRARPLLGQRVRAQQAVRRPGVDGPPHGRGPRGRPGARRAGSPDRPQPSRLVRGRPAPGRRGRRSRSP